MYQCCVRVDTVNKTKAIEVSLDSAKTSEYKNYSKNI